MVSRKTTGAGSTFRTWWRSQSFPSQRLVALTEHLRSLIRIFIVRLKTLCHYENMPTQIYWKFTTKNENFQIKNSDIFHSSAQNIDCWYSLEPPCRGGSNGYSQFMFLSRNKKRNVYFCKPQFYYVKEGLRGSKLYRHVFVMILGHPKCAKWIFWSDCASTCMQAGLNLRWAPMHEITSSDVANLRIIVPIWDKRMVMTISGSFTFKLHVQPNPLTSLLTVPRRFFSVIIEWRLLCVIVPHLSLFWCLVKTALRICIIF